jgi:hypothetical protein
VKKVWLSTTYYLDDAVQGLSPNAERAMTRAIAFCGNAENGGRMRLTAFSMLGLQRPNALVQELIAAHVLVVSDDPNYVEFRKWDEWQSDGNALVERQKKDAARQAKRRKALREAADTSRDMSRDVTGTEKRREDKDTTYVVSSSHVSTADERDDAAPAQLVIDVDQPTGKPVRFDGWKLVRDLVSAEHGQAARTALAMHAGAMLRSGTPEADVRSTIELWLTKPNLGPAVLPTLLSDVVRARSAPAGGKRSTTDERMAATQAAKSAERETGRRSVFDLAADELAAPARREVEA